MKNPLSALLLAIALALSASATAQQATPAARSANPWTGWHLSASVGAADGTTDLRSDHAYNAVNYPIGTTVHGGSVLGTLQAGYAWSLDRWLFGLEAEVGRARLRDSLCRGSLDHPEACGDSFLGWSQSDAELRYLGSLRWRIGYAVDPFMFYLTGGRAAVRSSNRIGVHCPQGCGPADDIAFESTTQVSSREQPTILGIGLEYRLREHWRIGLEQLRLETSDLTQTIARTATYGPQTISATSSARLALTRIRLIRAF